MQTIVALRGIERSGKTNTIFRVYEHFRQLGARVVREGDPARRRPEQNDKEIKGAVLEIDGVLVGFASQGDTPWQVQESAREADWVGLHHHRLRLPHGAEGRND